MPDDDSATARAFIAQRPELHALAARLLGSSTDADDAVQETWLRLARSPDASGIENPAGWLRTVLTRICLDTLRARRARRDDLSLDGLPVDHALGAPPPEADGRPVDPAAQAALADAVGRALLAVLNTLDPTERIAFVLHDMFAVSHQEIADIIGRSPTATKKLASRARLKVRGTTTSGVALEAQRRVVTAFLAATRAGDLEAILALLAPDVVRRADPTSLPHGVPTELRGAARVAEGTVVLAARATHADVALIDGAPGLLLAPYGRLLIALTFVVRDGLIQAYDVVADPARLMELDLAVLPGEARSGSRTGPATDTDAPR